jgi:hypothetical protein
VVNMSSISVLGFESLLILVCKFSFVSSVPVAAQACPYCKVGCACFTERNSTVPK